MAAKTRGQVPSGVEQIDLRGIESKLLLDDGNEHVGGHGAPQARLHGVLAGAQEMLEAPVLLDPMGLDYGAQTV